MKCPACGAPYREIRVVDTTHTGSQIRRRRECGLCEQRFSTVEVMVKDRQRTSTKEVVMVPEGVIAALTGT